MVVDGALVNAVMAGVWYSLMTSELTNTALDFLSFLCLQCGREYVDK
jgi:hypothetical protein